MRFAIDRYKIGTEEEVCASDYYGKYIPQRKSRFYCPECGETVYWRSRGGRKIYDEFYHETKTERSPECDKRVDGHAGLNLYERVGLPLFLSNIGGAFQLSIGFPALGNRLLNQATQKKVKVIIKGGTYERSTSVTPSIFFDNATTLIPIDFIPSYASNYSIAISSSSGIYEIMRHWSDYADGFDCGGAIFLHDEINCKKVRRGDSVSPGKQYYIVSNNFSPSYPEIKYRKTGSIQLNNMTYSIYSVEIDVSSKDEVRFTLISNYFKRLFNVWLLETAPEIIPLWPPCTLQDVLVPITEGKVQCAVSSGNASPHVYSYTDSFVSSIQVTRQNERVTIEIPSYSPITTLSVDRKYVGREITIARRPILLSDYKYQIAFERNDSSCIDVSKLLESDLVSVFSINSNAKLELYVSSKEKTYQHISVRNSKTLIPSRNNSCGIILVIEGSIYKQYQAEQSINLSRFDESGFVVDLMNHAKGTMVQSPRWVIYFSDRCRKKGYFEISASVQRLVLNGKIAIGALQFIHAHQRDVMIEK